MKNLTRGTVVVACLLSAAAFSNEQYKQQKMGGTGGAGQQMGQGQQLPQVPSDPKAYLERLRHGNQMEIKLGQLAQQRASNPQVREYAQKLVTDHQQLDQRLMTVAQQQNLKVGTEPKPQNDIEKKSMAASKAKMEQLETLTGANFDRAFITTMVEDHDMMLGKLLAGQQNPQLSSGQMASVIRESIPHVSQHRDQAYRILGTLKPEVSTGTGGAGGSMEHGGSGMDSQPQRR